MIGLVRVFETETIINAVVYTIVVLIDVFVAFITE